MTQAGAETEFSLINVFLETEDWSIGVNLNFWLILALVLIPVAILLFTFDRLTDAKNWAQKTEAAMKERRYFKDSEVVFTPKIEPFCVRENPV